MPISDAVTTLDRDLRAIFGDRLRSLVAYGSREQRQAPTRTLAVIAALGVEDLRACATRVASWHDAGLATPLLLDAGEFNRSLDAFPFEFGAILADHTVVSGSSPFEGLAVDPADLRRACEIQARSHLLHLREGYVETAGRTDAIADLVARSSIPLAALLRNIERFAPGHPTDAVLDRVAALNGKVSAPEALRDMLPEYLRAMADLVAAIDRWTLA